MTCMFNQGWYCNEKFDTGHKILFAGRVTKATAFEVIQLEEEHPNISAGSCGSVFPGFAQNM